MVERLDGSRTNLIVRGVDDVSPELRPDFKILEGQGRMLVPGKGECVVSKNIAKRFKGASLGSDLKVGEREKYRVVGIFSAGGSAAESEVWVDRKNLEQNTARAGMTSSVQVRAASAADMAKIITTLEDDTEFKLAAIPEVKLFADQSRSSIFLKVAGTIIAVLLYPVRSNLRLYQYCRF